MSLVRVWIKEKTEFTTTVAGRKIEKERFFFYVGGDFLT